MHSVAPWPGGGACVSSLLVTHASPLPLWRPPGVSGPPPLPADDRVRQCACTPPTGSRGNTSVLHFFESYCSPSSPKAGESRTALQSYANGEVSGACHSLSQGHVGRVQQELLPAVGAHQLHRLLVQAHLPETTPSHAHGAWRLPGGRGSRGRGHGQTEGWLGQEEARPGVATR